MAEWTERAELLFKEEGLEKLKNANVLIVGVGGVDRLPEAEGKPRLGFELVEIVEPVRQRARLDRLWRAIAQLYQHGQHQRWQQYPDFGRGRRRYFGRHHHELDHWHYDADPSCRRCCYFNYQSVDFCRYFDSLCRWSNRWWNHASRAERHQRAFG